MKSAAQIYKERLARKEVKSEIRNLKNRLDALIQETEKTISELKRSTK